jgi:hypothetical protein
MTTLVDADPKVKQDVTELILNSLPQTSYLQSFRGRKEGMVAGAVLGYNQDAITTIADRAKSLQRQIVQMNSRGEFSKISSELDAYYEAVNRSLPGAIKILCRYRRVSYKWQAVSVPYKRCV